MKIKKSKHVHHESGYTPVVNCKLTSRRLVCGTETDIQEVGANMWPMERWSACPASAVASAPHWVTSDGKNSENDVKKLYPTVIVHKQ